MPTYDYECGACGHAFELFQRITANAVRKCPKCGSMKAKRLIGAGGAIIFKGSGFYTTDYRSDAYKKQASADKSSAPSAPKSEKSEKGEKSDKGEGKKSSDAKKSG